MKAKASAWGRRCCFLYFQFLILVLISNIDARKILSVYAENTLGTIQCVIYELKLSTTKTIDKKGKQQNLSPQIECS